VLLAVAGTVPAQSIPIQTVPIVPADQFDIFPFGVFSAAGSWYGGLALALQQVDASRLGSSSVNTPGNLDTAFRLTGQLAPSVQDLSPGPRPHGNALAFAMIGKVLPGSGLSVGGSVRWAHGNALAFAMIGKVVPGSGLSVGGSVRWAKLRALDGVDLLYPGSTRVEQSGATVDARLGLLKEWAGDRSLEAVVLHERFRMTHDVTFLDAFWDPGTQQFLQSPRLVHDRDFTKRWGLQVKYERPLTASGWRIGWLATANRISQPDTPNLDLLNIPQDPGHAAGYELGVGVSRTYGPSVFGMDFVYQPIWSTTWAEAGTPAATSGGDTSRFHFSNALFRMGVSREVTLGPLTRTAALQLGLVVRSVHYNLAQRDDVDGTTRHLEESWLEWTPTWGLSLRFPELELRYRGLVTHGTDRLVTPANQFFANPAADLRPGFFPSPGPSMTLDGVHVVTHQVSVSLPLR